MAKTTGDNPRPKLMSTPRKHWQWLKFKHSNLSGRQKVLLWLSMIIFVAGAGVGGYFLYQHVRKVPPNNTKIEKGVYKPPTEASRLTGVQVAPELNKRSVTGVMIENSPESRPQSGLKDAGVVYEAIAEGGITRFLALFQESQPDYIGPVRSVRPYYLDFLLPFDAAIAHVGGAPQALSDIRTLGVKDLDEFANAGGYQRVTTRYAPHNVYTSTAKLDAVQAKKGFTTSTFTGFVRKADTPSAQPTARSIDLGISSYLYNVHYDYDSTANAYKRSEGGAAHTDERSGAQLQPKVVVALVMSRGIASDGQHTAYTTTGSGRMFVFQDGIFTEGTWSKASRKAQFVFTDANNQPIKLNAGQTWVSIVDAGTVSSKP